MKRRVTEGTLCFRHGGPEWEKGRRDHNGESGVMRGLGERGFLFPARLQSSSHVPNVAQLPIYGLAQYFKTDLLTCNVFQIGKFHSKILIANFFLGGGIRSGNAGSAFLHVNIWPEGAVTRVQVCMCGLRLPRSHPVSSLQCT